MKVLYPVLLAVPLAIGIPTAVSGAALRQADLAREVGALALPGGTWRAIPWRTCLQAARREAHQRGRPLLVWALGGDPSGRC